MQSWQRRAAACWRLFQQTACSCPAPAKRCPRHAAYVCSPQSAFGAFVRPTWALLVLKFPGAVVASVLRIVACSKTLLRRSVVSCWLLSTLHRQRLMCAPPVTCRCLPSRPSASPHTQPVCSLFMHQGSASLVPSPRAPSPPLNTWAVLVMSGESAPFSFR